MSDQNSKIVWSAERGWHDGPAAQTSLVAGRLHIDPAPKACLYRLEAGWLPCAKPAGHPGEHSTDLPYRCTHIQACPDSASCAALTEKASA
jgi:hypothetical protein